jgi:hypothetical protein
MSYSDRRAINVYVHAASQPVRQRKLAKFFTTIFHLIFSFVLIMIQCPASGSISHLVLRKQQNEVPENS